ncbi:MAG: rhomboid family intramembrane serine protease, partial [Piscinibacter sp.]
MPALPPITQALLLINVALFAADLLLGHLLTALFALWPLGSGRFMPWQVVSYGFLHGSFGHLFFNMLGLWMFGAELERIWGGKRYLQFYFASVLTAALTQLLVGLFTGGAPTVGASGGLFGLLLAFGMMFPNRTIMPLFPPIPMKAKTFVMVFGGL